MSISVFIMVKVLTHPRGRPSLVEPTGTSTTIIETSDSPGVYSYRWKYLYTIDADNILKFVTSEFIPVLSNSLVKSAANAGSVDTVVIENAGAGYNNGTLLTFLFVVIIILTVELKHYVQ